MKRRIFILWLSSVFVTFLFAAGLTGYGILKLLPAYQGSIENVLSTVTGSKVSLKVEYADWYGINPVIKISQIAVKDREFSLTIPQMTVQINVWQSLMDWRIVTQKVLIEEPRLSLYAISNGSDYHFLQELSVNEMNQIGRRCSIIVDYLLQQGSLTINQMQVDVIHGDSTTDQIEIDATYRQINVDKGFLHLGVQLSQKLKSQGQIDIVSVLEKKEDKYYFDSTLEDRENLLTTFINGISQKVKIASLVDHKLSLSMVSTTTQLDSVMVMGELSQLEFKSDMINESVFKNVVFHLKFFRHKDQFVLGVNPLSFIANHKRYIFRSALFALDKHRLAVNIPHLNLADFSSLVQMQESDWRKNITLSGVLTDVSFSIDLQNIDLNGMELAARFSNLGIAKSDQNVDFNGLSGTLWWYKNHLKLSIDSPSFSMAENHIFSRKWPEFNIKGNLEIVRESTMIRVVIDDLLLVNPQINFVVNGSVGVPLTDPKNFVLDIKGELTGRDLTAEYQAFLPQNGIPKPLYEWLMKCLYRAQSLKASVVIKGVAHKIPYPKKEGLFKIEADIQNASLSPYFGLGVAHQVHGSLHFDNELFKARVSSGWLGDVPIQKVDLSIDNIAPKVPATFSISADVKSSSQKIYAYLQQTKYQAFVDQISQYAVYQGDVSTHINMLIPLDDPKHKDQILGEVTVNKGILSVKKILPQTFYDVSGKILFNNEHITIEHLLAFLNIDAPFHLKGSMDFGDLLDPKLNLQANIVLPLIDNPKIDLTKTAFNKLIHGILPIKMSIKGQLSAGIAEVSSDFLGMSSRLGTPLNKVGFELMPVSFKSAWQREIINSSNQGSKAQVLSWYINSKLAIGAKSELSTGFTMNDTGEVSNLSIHGQLASLSSQLILNLMNSFNNTSQLPQDQAWQQQLKLNNSDGQANTSDCFVMANYSDCIYRNLNRSLNPKVMLTVDNFNILGTDYHKFKLQTNKAPHYTHYVAQADQQKELVMSIPDSLAEAIDLSASHLFFALPELKNTEQNNDVLKMFETILNADVLSKVPNMNIKLNNVQLGGYSLPNFIMAINTKGGVLFIPVLSAYDPNAKLLANIVLSSYGSYLHANLSSANWGNMLHNFGYGNLLRGGSGNVQIQLNWSSFVPYVPTISGKATVDLLNGVMLSVDSGFAKYIGLLSLDSYFKRLFMPYDDFEHRGMAFNNIVGAYVLKSGKATSNPSIIIDTPSFALVITGDVDIINKQLNQHIKYQPHFTGTTAAVAGVIGGPVVAFATYLGTKILGNTVFKNVGLTNFDVIGSWDKPVLQQVQ